MPRLERFTTAQVETAAVLVLAANVFLTACGSSSVQSLVRLGRPGRWLALLALIVVAALLAARLGHGRPGRALSRLLVAATFLGALAVVSTGWSVAPRLTFERGISLVLALAAAGLLGYAVESQPRLARNLVAGVVLGGAAVVCAGLIVYAIDPGAAVQAKTFGVPARWRGLGENPNTISMLAGVDVGAALWLALTTTRRSAVWALAGAGFAATIFASGSRGALLAGLAGALVAGSLSPLRASYRFATAAATVAVAAAGVVFVDAVATPGPLGPPPPGSTAAGSGGGSGGGSGKGPNGEPLPQAHSFTSSGSSGRVAAWRLAYRTASERPVLGYGFGTEEQVFVDRLRDFHGSRPENSFVGMYLQLGATGVAALLAVLLAAAAAVYRAVRNGVEEAPALAGMLLAGALLLVVQSYVYAVGNVATMTFWVAATTCAGVTGARR